MPTKNYDLQNGHGGRKSSSFLEKQHESRPCRLGTRGRILQRSPSKLKSDPRQFDHNPGNARGCREVEMLRQRRTTLSESDAEEIGEASH
jgi:hypothetical protein